MIAGVDSAYPPGAASVAAAHADGVKLWNGYFAGPNILHGWSQADFDRVRVLGGTPIAYASGYSPPQTLKAQAAAWNVRLCLDVEGGIRPDGTWVQPWLDESGAGLYGNQPVHNGRHAAFHVLAAYPASGDPHATWGAGRPPGPCGWQWHGSISRYAANVDLCWFDDWFAAATASTGSSRMFAFRPDGSDRHDVVLVTDNGSNLRHWWSGTIAGDATNPPPSQNFGAPPGKTLLPGTEWVCWDSTGGWMVWGAQASDGSQWYGYGTLANGNTSGWKPWANVTSDLPGGTPGAPGPPGPAGPAGTVPAHAHTVATTTTDTP